MLEKKLRNSSKFYNVNAIQERVQIPFILVAFDGDLETLKIIQASIRDHRPVLVMAVSFFL